MRYTKEDLEKYIFEDKLSYEEIGKKYGVLGVSIKKEARKLGIDLPVRRKKPKGWKPHNAGTAKKAYCKTCAKDITQTFGNKFCNIECQHIYQHKNKYEYYLVNQDTAKYYNMSTFKPDFLKEQSGKCAICDMTQIWNDKPLTFVLDHIDGRASNNKRGNLRLICHNCDSQLDTYK